MSHIYLLRRFTFSRKVTLLMVIGTQKEDTKGFFLKGVTLRTPPVNLIPESKVVVSEHFTTEPTSVTKL